MKKLLFIIIAATAFSCRKDSQSVNFENLSPAAKEVAKMNSIERVKQASLLLADNERQELWLSKFTSILNNDKDKLSTRQTEIIQSLMDFLNKTGISNLKSNPVAGEKFLLRNLNKIEEVFTKEQTYLLVECAFTNENFSIFKSDKYLLALESSKNSPIAAASVACGCRYDIGCGFGNICGGSCSSTSSGCGLFGTSSCTGACSQGNGEPIIK